MCDVEKEVQAAAESTGLLTPEELAALMERRSQERTEHWTALERFVRVPLLKLRGRV